MDIRSTEAIHRVTLSPGKRYSIAKNLSNTAGAMRRLIMGAQPLTNFLKASLVRSTAADAWVATRFMGTAGGEVRGQRSEVRGQETVLKNVESLKALQRYRQ